MFLFLSVSRRGQPIATIREHTYMQKLTHIQVAPSLLAYGLLHMFLEMFPWKQIPYTCTSPLFPETQSQVQVKGIVGSAWVQG